VTLPGSDSASRSTMQPLPKHLRRPRNLNELAFQVFQEATGEYRFVALGHGSRHLLEYASNLRREADQGKPAALALGKPSGVKAARTRRTAAVAHWSSH